MEAPVARRHHLIRSATIAGVVVLVVALILAALVWVKFFKTAPQTALAKGQEGAEILNPDDRRFAYGSLGSEQTAGIPYPILMVLPRIFPDLVAKYAPVGYGPAKAVWGGYAAFGMPWEQGQRLPVGLSIKQAGYERVTLNCAVCHTATWRMSAGDDEHIALGGPAHTTDLQALFRFLFACAHDRRFTPERLLPEINLHFPLDPVDDALYANWIIPSTRAELLVAERELGFMEAKPPWGPGRDDAFNLPKYALAQEPWDHTTGNTDFPAVWRMANRDGGWLHTAGEAHDLSSVVTTSALGIGAVPDTPEHDQINRWIEGYIRKKDPPPFPGKIDVALAARGKGIYDAGCASCHAPGGKRTGQVVPQGEVGTDLEHIATWRQKDADASNRVVGLLGFSHAKFTANDGYVAKPLVGVWLLGPYLHNGSVPTVADLLAPTAERPAVFWRGYDVLDPARLGFSSTDADAQAHGWRYDTHVRGNGNSGHVYGTTLSAADKQALIEYLKTL